MAQAPVELLQRVPLFKDFDRGDLEAWSDRSRRVFYGAIGLGVVDIGAAIGLSPMGADALAFFAVLACCVWAIVRTWRDEHTYAA